MEYWMYVRVARELELVGNLFDAFFNFIWLIISANKFLVGSWKNELLLVRVKPEVDHITNLEFNIFVLQVNSLFIMVVGGS